MPPQHLGERLQIPGRIHRAGWVAGVVENQPPRLRGDRSFQLLRVQSELVRGVGSDHHRFAAREQHHVRIAHPVRRRNDDLLAGIERRGEGVVDDLLAAVADEHPIGCVAQSVLPLELAADRLAQLRDPGQRRVLRLAFTDGAYRRRLDVVRRVEVRLSRGEGDDIAAGPRHLHGLRRDDGGGRGLDAAHAPRGDGHCLPAASASALRFPARMFSSP